MIDDIKECIKCGHPDDIEDEVCKECDSTEFIPLSDFESDKSVYDILASIADNYKHIKLKEIEELTVSAQQKQQLCEEVEKRIYDYKEKLKRKHQ